MAIQEQDYLWVGSGGIRPTRNGQPSISLPQTGNGPSWNTPAPPDWSDWETITTGESEDYILDSLNMSFFSTGAFHVWIQLGIGAGNTIIGTFPYVFFGYVPSGGYTVPWGQFDLRGYLLPAGTKLSIRSYTTGVVANEPRCTAIISAMPYPPQFSEGWDEVSYRQGGISSFEVVPSCPSTIAVASGGSNIYGDWVTAISEAQNRLLVYALFDTYNYPIYPARDAGRWQIGIDEVAQEMVPVPKSAHPLFYTNGLWRLSRPVEVLAGEQVSVRYQNSSSPYREDECALAIQNLNF